MTALRILWIEDKGQQIQRFVELLKTRGKEVTVAATGEEAITALDEARKIGRPYDVVLLDIMLPKGEGTAIDPSVYPELMGEEIVRQMQERGFRTPIIGITAIADDELYDRIGRTYKYITDFLKKPITMDELEKAISRAVTATGHEGTQT